MLQTDIRYNICNKYLVNIKRFTIIIYFFPFRRIPFSFEGRCLSRFLNNGTRVFVSSLSAMAPGTVKSQIGMSLIRYAGGYGL